MPKKRELSKKGKGAALGEDRTHDLQISQAICDYETDALPTALPRLVNTSILLGNLVNVNVQYLLIV